MKLARLLAGRYEPIRQLGSGGAGELVLVRDTRRDGQPCALKILRPRIRDAALAELFRREFLVLTEIRHECIVAVRDFGLLEDDVPYFTMDFVPGESCRSFVREDRLETGDYLDLASGMLAALSHVHACGVLHRDVKPENIIMRRGDSRLEPVLVDFGLAVTAGAQRAGECSGTLPYIAPEVLSGGSADERADLFALGMVLFEVATGRAVGDRRDLLRSPGTVLARNRVRRIVRERGRGSIPRRFEDFVSRLMAPTRFERYPSAAQALHDLREIYGGELFDAAPEARRRKVLGESPLVGRTAALQALTQRVEALREARLLEPIAVVGGPSGIGTSRLLATLRNQAAVSGCLVCSGGSLRELAADLVSHPSVGKGDLALGSSPREHVFRIDSVLHEFAEEHPVLVLDDVHTSDAAACAALREWIASLESREGRAPLLFVLGGCAEGDSPGAELLRTSGRAVPHELRDLAPLKRGDIRAALATILGVRTVPGEVVQTLQRSTNGNPRALNELLLLLVGEGVLDLEGETPALRADELSRMSLPKGVVDVTRRRIERLPDDARAAARRIALIDAPLGIEAARVLAGEGPLGTLLEERLLVLDRSRVRFAAELARRAADSLKGGGRSRELRHAATLLREIAPSKAARLLAEAGDLAEAREVGLPAARALVGAGRFAEAQRTLRPLLGEPPDPDTGGLLVRVLNAVGHYGDAVDVGRALLAAASPDVELRFLVATALRSSGRLEEALDLLRGVAADGDEALRVRLLNAEAALLDSMERFDEALEVSKRAEDAAGSLFGLDGRIARVRANILRRAERFPQALAVERAIVGAPEAGVNERISARINSAVLDHEAGRLRAAADNRRAACRLAESVARTLSVAHARYGLGGLFVECGRVGKGATLYERSRELYEALANEEYAAHSLARLAEALLLAGRPLEAEQRLRRAESLPVIAREPDVRRSVLRVRARMAHLSGGLDRAAEIYDEILDAPEGVEHERAEASIGRAEALAEGDESTAEAAWRAALRSAWQSRERGRIPWIRVGLAECAAAKGAWNLAERLLGAREPDLLAWRTPARARALAVRAGAALHRREPGAAARRIEEAVAIVNRCDDAPARAEVYAAVASLLEETELQRYLRQPTAQGSAALLEVARDIWVLYGNDTMLRKIDLHLSELPRPAADPLAGPDADRLVKVLHVTRELNREFDRDRLLALILDRAIELTGAERGFVILLKEGREIVHLARNLDRESVSEPERKVSSQIIREVVHSGRIVRSENAEQDQRFHEYLSVHQLHLRSVIAVPFRAAGKTVGALYLDNRFRTGNFSDEDERLLELFSDQAVTAIEKADLVRELEAKKEELEEHYRKQKTELRRQGKALTSARRELKQHRKARGWTFEKVIARSVSMQGIVREAKRIAATELPVLLTGENGTGKEVLARAIHFGSSRQDMPFVAINCAAVPEQLLEAELFGHVRGSFTGAERDRAGLFEEADGGTLFLDEIGDMPPNMQVKLLRTIESGEVRRVGESQVRTVDVRVLAATNADLERFIRNGKFRQDLYYRVAGFVVHIPPLRERLEDVEPLAYAFVDEAARREGRPGLRISNEAIGRLESFSWSGNVRELRNIILRAVVTAQGDVIRPEDVKFDQRGPTVLPGLDPGRADAILEELAGDGLELNARQQTAVNRVLTRGKLTFAIYQQIFRVSKSTAARDLEALVASGLLEKRGRTRATVYLPGARLQDLARRLGAK